MAHRQDSSISSRAGVTCGMALSLLFLAGAISVIYCGIGERGRPADDQRDFHLPVVRMFAAQWPHVDLRDYSSATTPGYHLAIAAVDRFVSSDLRVVRIAGALFTVGLLMTLGFAVGSRAGAFFGFLLCLPCVCSFYVFSSGAWLLPDNAGWWGVLVVMLIALRPRCDGWTYLAAGAAMLALVLVRQSHLWAAAPLVAAAWMADDSSHPMGPAARVRRVVLMGIALLPSLAALGWLIHLWHGMVPPNQQALVGGGNPAGPVAALGVAGLLGVFFLPLLVTSGAVKKWAMIALGGLIAGGVLGAVPATSYNFAAGRYSGIWNAALRGPVFYNRSLVIELLAMAGGMVVALFTASLPRRERWVWIMAILAFAATQLVTRKAFQRYDEPLVLIAAALILSRRVAACPRWAWAGPIALALGLVAITVLSLR